MKLAIRENVLQGDSVKARLTFAKNLGVDGIEFDDVGLAKRIPDIVEALNAVGLSASAIDVGCTPLIHPDYDKRDEAIVAIREGMANQLDLGASGTMFLPHCIDTPRLPDLHPYKSSMELEAELFVKQLKITLLDLAYAMGAMLFLPVAKPSQTHLVNSVERAFTILEKTGNHPHMKISVDASQLTQDVLQDYSDLIGYIRFSNDNKYVKSVYDMLKNISYEGWIAFADVDLVSEWM